DSHRAHSLAPARDQLQGRKHSNARGGSTARRAETYILWADDRCRPDSPFVTNCRLKRAEVLMSTGTYDPVLGDWLLSEPVQILDGRFGNWGKDQWMPAATVDKNGNL